MVEARACLLAMQKSALQEPRIGREGPEYCQNLILASDNFEDFREPFTSSESWVIIGVDHSNNGNSIERLVVVTPDLHPQIDP